MVHDLPVFRGAVASLDAMFVVNGRLRHSGGGHERKRAGMTFPAAREKSRDDANGQHYRCRSRRSCLRHASGPSRPPGADPRAARRAGGTYQHDHHAGGVPLRPRPHLLPLPASLGRHLHRYRLRPEAGGGDGPSRSPVSAGLRCRRGTARHARYRSHGGGGIATVAGRPWRVHEVHGVKPGEVRPFRSVSGTALRELD